MKEDKGPLSWIKKQFSKENHVEKKKGNFPYLVLILVFGIGIMMISNLLMKDESASEALPVFNNNNKQEDIETFGQSAKSSLIEEYEQAYESQLKEVLDTIVGVSDVSVIVNVDATEKQVLEKNSKTQTQVTDEMDREGGKRKVEDQAVEEQLVTIQEGEKEVPIVVERKKPVIRGVLVVAKGAENIQVKKWILEAVTRSLDVPSHRVSILPKKTKGDS